MTSTLLPQALTGTSTGTWTSLPEATPGESVACPSALAPPPCAPWPPSRLAQELPIAGLRTPTTSTVLPQRLTGACTGACTVLPESAPGDPVAEPWAPEPVAWAVPLTAASTPVAAAIVIRPLRVTCRMC
ncbi:hypothetical protein SFUMM280S_07462 [Streptomyces fumanus]